MFPIQAFLNHDCRYLWEVVLRVSSSDQFTFRSNTESLEHPETHHIEIYAREDIPAGTQLTTSYVSASLERNQRRQQLRDIWNFWCRCPTCCDNTEGGTFRQTSPSSKLNKTVSKSFSFLPPCRVQKYETWRSLAPGQPWRVQPSVRGRCW